MAYPEPASSFSDLEVISASSECKRVELRDKCGRLLQIEHLKGFGWCLETRHDLKDSGFLRQPITGAQNEVERSSLVVSNRGQTQNSIVAEKFELLISRQSGAFSLNESGREVFTTCPIPFSHHVSPVQIREDLFSRTVTDWDCATPWRLKPAQLETHMVRFQFPLDGTPIIGLAGSTGEFNRLGYRFELCNNDNIYHIPSRLPLYQSWPISFHRATNGGWLVIFNDNPSRTFVDFGDFYSGIATYESVTGNSRVYIGYGENLAEASAKVCRLLGRPLFPPQWAFGYQQCRFSYTSTKEVRDVAHRLRSEGFPLDCIYFDGDYMDEYRVFTNNPEKFGDLKETIEDLRAENIETVCIVDPGLKVEPGYSCYDRFARSGAYLKAEDGSAFPAKVWPGQCLLPDFLDKRAFELWSTMQAEWLNRFPFSGIWNDMNEPSNFDGFSEKNACAMSERGPHKAELNLYGYGMARASQEGWQRYKPGTRGLVITRSGYPGVQSSAVAWHGDNSCWWEHLRLAIDFAIEFSLSGLFFTGPDIPGFFGNPSDDHAVRAYQLASFLPFFRGHSYTLTKNKEPFVFEPKTRERILAAIKLRYSLLREWYSGYERSIREFTSPLRPILTEDGAIVRDAFLLFDKFLVCPITQRDELMRPVYLPRGIWYRLGNPDATPINGNSWIMESTSLDSIPVFVRGGSIVVRNEPKQCVKHTFSAPEKYEIYRDENGHASGYWFSDNGESINDPQAQRVRLSVTSESAYPAREPL